MSWQLNAMGHVADQGAERKLMEDIRDVLSRSEAGTTSANFVGMFHGTVGILGDDVLGVPSYPTTSELNAQAEAANAGSLTAQTPTQAASPLNPTTTAPAVDTPDVEYVEDTAE